MKILYTIIVFTFIALEASAQDQQDSLKAVHEKGGSEAGGVDSLRIAEKRLPGTNDQPSPAIPLNENCVIRFDEIDYTKDPE